jgi:ankyrin repeat protein
MVTAIRPSTWLPARGAIPPSRRDLSPPIFEGCKVDYTGVVRLLLESGADPSIRNDDGKTALDIACQ